MKRQPRSQRGTGITVTNDGTALETVALTRNRLLRAVAVVLLCLAGTATTAFLAQNEIAGREKALFERILDGLNVATIHASKSYEQRLLGLACFVSGSKEITLQDWSNYIAAIESQDLAPAIWDVGLFDVVPGSNSRTKASEQAKRLQKTLPVKSSQLRITLSSPGSLPWCPAAIFNRRVGTFSKILKQAPPFTVPWQRKRPP